MPARRHDEDLRDAVELGCMNAAIRSGAPVPRRASRMFARSGLQRRFGGGGGGRRFARDPRGGRPPGGGPVYLLDYNDATFTRASEAAFVDPRPVAAGGTGAYAWDFVRTLGLNDPENVAGNVVTAPNDLTDAAWVDGAGTPVVTANTDTAPDGTLTADTLADDSAGAPQEVLEQTLTVASGTEYAYSMWAKKNASPGDSCLWVSISGVGGTMTGYLALDTGAWTFFTGAGITDAFYISEAVSGWWRLVFRQTTSSTTSVIGLGATRPTASHTGSVVVWGVTAAPTNGVGETPWAVPDEARIFSDGAILIEGAATNEEPESKDFTAWAADGSASATADQVTAPDGAADADQVDFSTSATDRLRDVTGITSGAGSDATDAIVSCWLRCASGTESARIGLRQKDGTTYDLSSDLTVTTTWQRFEHYVSDIGTGATAPSSVLQNATDAAARTIYAWGFQVEHQEDHVHSDIRTAGATATLAEEAAVIDGADLPAALQTGAWAIDFWFAWDSANPKNVYGVWGDASNHLRFAMGSNLVRLVAGATNYDVSGVSWSAGDKVTVVCDFQGDLEVFVNSVSQGTVTIGGADDWSAFDSDPTVYFGSNGGSATIDGVMSQPRAA